MCLTRPPFAPLFPNINARGMPWLALSLQGGAPNGDGLPSWATAGSSESDIQLDTSGGDDDDDDDDDGEGGGSSEDDVFPPAFRSRRRGGGGGGAVYEFDGGDSSSGSSTDRW